jgi:uncharacterized protein
MTRSKAFNFAILFASFFGLISFAACSAGGRKVSAAEPDNRPPAREHWIRRPLSNSSQIKSLVDSAFEQSTQTVEYNSSYTKLAYPNGDVPISGGVCADVIVRAFRSAGVDLQREVHEDMTHHFSSYPSRWAARRPDSNIDHRRVPNLMTLFDRRKWSVAITRNRADYYPGDVVAWELDNKLLHIGLVTDAVSADSSNYLVAHNIGYGTKIEDVLMSWKIIGHYRIWK